MDTLLELLDYFFYFLLLWIPLFGCYYYLYTYILELKKKQPKWTGLYIVLAILTLYNVFISFSISLFTLFSGSFYDYERWRTNPIINSFILGQDGLGIEPERSIFQQGETWFSILVFFFTLNLLLNITLIIWSFTKKKNFRTELQKRIKAILVLITISIIPFTLLVILGDSRSASRLYQTCLSSPSSIGCEACQKIPKKVYDDLDYDDFDISIKKYKDNRDISICLKCEQEFQGLLNRFEGSIEENLSEDCKDY